MANSIPVEFFEKKYFVSSQILIETGVNYLSFFKVSHDEKTIINIQLNPTTPNERGFRTYLREFVPK